MSCLFKKSTNAQKYIYFVNTIRNTLAKMLGISQNYHFTYSFWTGSEKVKRKEISQMRTEYNRN